MKSGWGEPNLALGLVNEQTDTQKHIKIERFMERRLILKDFVSLSSLASETQRAICLVNSGIGSFAYTLTTL